MVTIEPHVKPWFEHMVADDPRVEPWFEGMAGVEPLVKPGVGGPLWSMSGESPGADQAVPRSGIGEIVRELVRLDADRGKAEAAEGEEELHAAHAR